MDADRVTGNLVWLGVEHPETRPTKEDGMPDWDQASAFRRAECDLGRCRGAMESAQGAPDFRHENMFDRSFDLRMSAKLAGLGYEIETKLQEGEDGRRLSHLGH